MAKQKKNRKPTLAQLKAKLAAMQERNLLLLARALGHLSDKSMTKRNRKRLKDAKNSWRRDYD